MRTNVTFTYAAGTPSIEPGWVALLTNEHGHPVRPKVAGGVEMVGSGPDPLTAAIDLAERLGRVVTLDE